MTLFAAARHLFSVGVCATIGLIAAEVHAKPYETVYSFRGPTIDGATAISGLTLSGSLLYGTTQNGGTASGGTLFSFAPETRSENVLHNFSFLDNQGNGPVASVTAIGDTLYGATPSSGGSGSGTIYSYGVNDGAVTTLHRFVAGFPVYDGGSPQSTMIAVGDTLYGTTELGGRNQVGAIFSYNVSTGVEQVLHSFTGSNSAGSSSSDGASPVSALTLVGSKLYGTTSSGGAHGVGTIVSYDLNSGAESVLYNFSGPFSGAPGSDGAFPAAGLTLNGSTLYGTTQEGGTSGGGTLFQFDINTHAESVLYSFGGAAAGDGSLPLAGVTLVRNSLYGTTKYGGANDTANAGTVFQYNLLTGVETLLHSFSPVGIDGFNPTSGLTLDGPNLYGTTLTGGQFSSGTIYAISLPEPGSIRLLLTAIACAAPFGMLTWQRRRGRGRGVQNA